VINLADLYDTAAVQSLVVRYQSLSFKDQNAVKYFSMFFSLVICIYGLIIPVMDYSYQAKKRYQQAHDDLHWMHINTPANISTAPRRNPNDSLLGVASSTSKKYYVKFSRYEAQDENTLNVSFERVLFKNLVLWLENLENNHGVSIYSISSEEQGATGYVAARVVLKG
jgi:type II secretory pathway component PulM